MIQPYQTQKRDGLEYEKKNSVGVFILILE